MGRTAAIVYADLGPRPSADDQDVMVQADGFRRVLEGAGWRVVDIPLTLDLESAASRLRELGPAVAVNLVETLDGRDGLQYLGPALLDHLGIPYTGSPTGAVFLSAQKLEGKRHMELCGIATPAWTPLDMVARDGPPGAGPWIVKPASEHASRGIDDSSVMADAASLLRRAAQPGAAAFYVESYIEGREMAVSLLSGPDGLTVLPPAEIDFSRYPAGKPRIVGYAAKWEEHAFEYAASVRSFDFGENDAPLLAALDSTARRCWDVFGLRGYARVDYRVDRAGRPWVLEVNTNPCLSPDAGFAAAAQRGGLTLDAVLVRILDDATGRRERARNG